jgi:hypothetical protein
MMEILLARMNASMKEHMQEIMARKDANQTEMKVDRKADQAEMKADRKADQARLEARIETNMEKDRKDVKGIMKELNAKADGKQEEMLARMREDIKSSQAEMRSTVCAMRSELEETIQREMRAVIQPIRSELDETTACNKATETDPDPRMMQSIEEHQEIPKGEAAVTPVGGLRKWCRVRNLAAFRCQKMRERTQGKTGSRRNSAATCRKVSRRAKVWHGEKETYSGELGLRKIVSPGRE